MTQTRLSASGGGLQWERSEVKQHQGERIVVVFARRIVYNVCVREREAGRQRKRTSTHVCVCKISTSKAMSVVFFLVSVQFILWLFVRRERERERETEREREGEKKNEKNNINSPRLALDLTVLLNLVVCAGRWLQRDEHIDGRKRKN